MNKKLELLILIVACSVGWAVSEAIENMKLDKQAKELNEIMAKLSDSAGPSALIID